MICAAAEVFHLIWCQLVFDFIMSPIRFPLTQQLETTVETHGLYYIPPGQSLALPSRNVMDAASAILQNDISSIPTTVAHVETLHLPVSRLGLFTSGYIQFR